MDTVNPISPTLPIVCRPEKAGWGLFAFFALIGLAPLIVVLGTELRAKNAKPDTFLLWIIIPLISALALWAYWMLHARIEANEEGLRWRGLRGWTVVDWSAIQDYYLLHVPDQKTYVIETTQGKVSVSSFFAGGEAMARAIARHAVNTQVHEWEFLGCRAGDVPPCQFRYHSGEIWGMIAFFTLGGSTFLLISAPDPITNFNADRQSIGLLWALSVGILETLGIGLVLALYAMFIAVSWQALQSANQTVETSTTGIVFTDGERQIKARWDQVIQYGPSPGLLKTLFATQYYVRTEAGNFAIHLYLRKEALLRSIIRHWAPKSASTEIPSSDINVIGGEKSLWGGGALGSGNRVHHYRTRTNRAHLGGMSFFSILFLTFPWILQWADVEQKISTTTLVSIDAIFTFLTLWSWWRYLAARIETSDTGIIERSAFGARQLRWNEVTAITRGEFLVTLHGADKKIRYWATIANADELKSEIERRTSLCIPEKNNGAD